MYEVAVMCPSSAVKLKDQGGKCVRFVLLKELPIKLMSDECTFFVLLVKLHLK